MSLINSVIDEHGCNVLFMKLKLFMEILCFDVQVLMFTIYTRRYYGLLKYITLLNGVANVLQKSRLTSSSLLI